MVKLVDVAKAVHMNPSTVSRALNNCGGINSETRDYIIDTAKEMGYRPNRVARAMKGNGLNTIGVIVPELYSNHFGQMIDNFARFAEELGYSIIVSVNHFDKNQALNCIESMDDYNVDGFIMVYPNCEKISDELLRRWENGNRKFVVVQGPKDDTNKKFDRVAIDDRLGYDRLAAWIKETCSYECAWIGDDVSLAPSRLFNFTEACKKHDITLKEEYICSSEEMYEPAGYCLMKKLMEKNDHPKTVVCAYDYLAIGAYKAVFDCCPDKVTEYTILGYDGIRELDFLPYKIHTIKPDYDLIAKSAIDLLIDRIKNEDNESKKILTSPDFI